MYHIGLFSGSVNEACHSYRGIYRNNDLLDHYESVSMKECIDTYFCNSYDGIHKLFSTETLASTVFLYENLIVRGWKGDIILWSEDKSLPATLDAEFLGIDICGEGLYYSPLGDGFLLKYEEQYTFYRNISHQQFQMYANDINEYGLFSNDIIARQFAAYCNQISKEDSHAIETEVNWHPIYIFRYKPKAIEYHTTV